MKLSPSLFAADPLALRSMLPAIEAFVDSWHFDVMDGRFAKAHGLNETLFAAMKQASSVPIDVHLMIETPGDWPVRFAKMGARLVAVHGEALEDPAPVLAAIREAGARAYLAYTPDTPVDHIICQIPAADGVLLLTAPQGGGVFRCDALRRVGELPRDIPKIVDGGLGPEHFDVCRAVGVDTIVVGRSLFEQPNLGDRARELFKLAQAAPCLVSKEDASPLTIIPRSLNKIV